MTKRCSKCGETKPVPAFSRKASSKDGLRSQCKACIAEHNAANRGKIAKRDAAYRAANRDKIAKRDAEHYAANREERLKWQAEYYANHREERLKRQAEYNASHRKERAEYLRNRKANDIQYRLAHNLRSRLRLAIKNNQKTGSAVSDLGCTIAELKKHLEKQFQPGMSWDNYGLDGWHIDHRKPLDAFNLENREELLEACHYTNLQPMLDSENCSKGAKILEETAGGDLDWLSRTHPLPALT